MSRARVTSGTRTAPGVGGRRSTEAAMAVMRTTLGRQWLTGKRRLEPLKVVHFAVRFPGEWPDGVTDRARPGLRAPAAGPDGAAAARGDPQRPAPRGRPRPCLPHAGHRSRRLPRPRAGVLPAVA